MEPDNDALRYQFLAEGYPNRIVEKSKAIFRALPDGPRCIFCHSPFEGFGGSLTRLIGRDQSREDPRFCKACIRYGHEHHGGAHIDMAMVFADVRGSAPLAERVGDREFRRLIDHFFCVSARALIHSGAMLDRLAGDEAIGFLVPGLAGAEYPLRALESAREVLVATGHTNEVGPWIPVRVGAHVGNGYMGMVGSPDGVTNFTALGDDINIGGGIASAAGPAELLASLSLCEAAGVDVRDLDRRELSLKGKQETIEVAVIPLASDLLG